MHFTGISKFSALFWLIIVNEQKLEHYSICSTESSELLILVSEWGNAGVSLTMQLHKERLLLLLFPHVFFKWIWWKYVILKLQSFAIVLSHSEGCLFTLLIFSFVMQKLLILIRSYLFIFAFISSILGGGS